MSRARASGERVEDLTKRDEFSATFANPDGTWTTEVSTGRVHYRDGAGEWQRVDTTLVPTDRVGYEAVTKASSTRTFVPADVASTPVRVEDAEGRFVSMRLLGAAGAPQVEAAQARVPDGPAATSVTYAVTPGGVKETITLPALPGKAPVFEYEVRASEGLTARVTADNEVEFLDTATGEAVGGDGVSVPVFRVPAPYMIDANGAGESSTAVPMTLEATPGGWRLTATPDYGWLSDPARVYPVLVDPSPTTDTALIDTWMDQGAPNSTHGLETRLQVGTDDAGNRHRALVKFPAQNEIPTKAKVTSAEIILYLDHGRTSQFDHYAIYRMRDLTETGGTTWDRTATWNNSGTGTAWTGAGGAWQPFADADTVNLSGNEGGPKTWSVTGMAANWVASGWKSNNGAIVKAVDEAGTDNNLFFVSEQGDVANRWPKLSISWVTAAPTVTQGSVAVDPSLTADGVEVARSLTPTLSATASDPDSPSLEWKFTLQRADGSVIQTWSGTKANPNPGQPVAFSQPVPAGVLAENGSYKVVFTVSDETTTEGVESLPLAFTVDQPPAVPSGLTVSPNTAGTPVTTTVTDPELSALVEDPDASESLTAEFQLATATSESAVILTGSDEVDAGERAVYALSPEDGEALEPGQTYYFRVGSSDAVDAQQSPVKVTWSEWMAFVVARDAAESVPLQLAEPLTVWDTGPVLTWTPYREDPDVADDDLVNYEIYRSCVDAPGGACAASYATYEELRAASPTVEPIAVLDPGATSYRDTGATASAGNPSSVDPSEHRYWVVARTVADGTAHGTTASNSRDVVMPLVGRVRRVFIGSDVPDATISEGEPDQEFPGVLEVDSNDPTEGRQRALLDFDVSIIRPGMRVTSAAVTVNQRTDPGTGSGTFGLHELVTQDFVEGDVTWNQASAADSWTAGGAMKDMATRTATAGTARAVTFADSAEMRSMVARWVNQRGDNHGVAIRATDESSTGRRFLDLVPSESAQQDLASLTEMRPRLTVEHMTTSTLDTIRAAGMPQRFVPGATINVPVTVTNTTDTAFPADLVLGYRWTLPPDGTEDQLTASSGRTAELKETDGIDATDGLAPGERVRVMLPVLPPINSDTGSQDMRYNLELDLWDPTTNTWFTRPTRNYRYYDETTLSEDQRKTRDELLADEACAMMPTGLKCPNRLVETPTSSGLGLEEFATYAGEETGAGSQAMVNLDNGNLAWTYDAMSNPSVGPSFFARIAYNSSDVGAIGANPSGGFGWSVQPGTLNRLNTKLITSGSDYKAVTLVDGDGTSHVWRDPVDADGAGTGDTLAFRRPAGVGLDLWFHPSEVADKKWEFSRPDGTRFYFRDGSSGDKLAMLPTSVVDLSGNTLTYTYNTDSRLASMVDDKARTVAELAYNADGRVTAICDVDDRVMAFEYDPAAPSHLMALRDGRQATPGGPCTPGNLVNDDDTKVFGFTYTDDQSNESTNLTSVTDPRGNRTDFVHYPTNVGTPSSRLKSWTDRGSVGTGGRTTTVEYYKTGDTLPAGYTEMPEGSSTMARVTDDAAPVDYETIYAMDGYGRTIHLRDPEATHPDSPAPDASTLLTWDDDHNVVRMEEPNGGVSRWAYNADGYPTRMWDAEAVADGGPPTRLAYDQLAVGVTFLTSITTPLGHTTTFTPDAAGRLATVTDPAGSTTSYGYNADGLTTSATDPRGNETTYAYPSDAVNVGLPTVATPPAPTAGGDTQRDATTRYTYDSRGNTLSVTREVVDGGAVTDQITDATAAYDVYGRPTQVTTAGAQGPDRTTAYTYDTNDNLTAETAPNQAVVGHVYGRDDQEVRTTLPDNDGDDTNPARTISYAYDALGRLCRQIAPQGTHPADPSQVGCPTGPAQDPPAYATDTWYDAFNATGRAVSTTAAAGTQVVTTQETYDAAGDLVAVTDPRGVAAGGDATTEYVYDLAHRPIQVIDALGYATRSFYDADGQTIRTVDQEGNPTKYGYDTAGRLTSTTVLYDRPGRPVAEHTTRYVYDAAGNQIKVIRPERVDPDTGAPEGPYYTRTMFDENNRPTVLQQAYAPTGPDYTQPATTFTSYDAFGRMAAQSIPVHAPAVTDADVDPIAPPTTPAPEWTRYSHYDSGEIASSKDPAGITTTYAYTLTGQQSRRTLTGATEAGDASAESRTMTWAYHPDGSLKARSDTASRSVAAVVDNPTATTTGTWPTITPANRAGQVGTDYRVHAADTSSTDSHTWEFTAPAPGSYRIEFACPAVGKDETGQGLEPDGSRAPDASYTVATGDQAGVTATGDHTGCGDAPWRPLKRPGANSFTLEGGAVTTITLTPSSTGTVAADAIRIVDTDLSRDYTYSYDANGQRTGIHDETPGALVTDYITAYDELGRSTAVTEKRDDTVLRSTTYTHDVNSNVTSTLTSRAAVDGSNPLTRTTDYTWDARNNLDTLTANNTNDPAQARTWEYTWNPRGLLHTLIKPGPQTGTGTATGNIIRYGYFANGLMRFKTEKTPGPSPTTIARHDLLYNPDGDLIRDIAEIQTPGSTTTRRQTSNYTYTPDQRLAGVTKSGKNTGKDETYTYDAAGNILTQEIGNFTTRSTYRHNRLTTTTSPAGTADYDYDPFGRLADITGADPTTHYEYDGFDRTILQSRGEVTKTATYDALDRTIEETVAKTGGTSRTTRLVYAGTSDQVAVEEQKNTSGTWTATKAYNYGPDGRPVMLTATPLDGTGPKTRLYSTNPRGDIETLTNPDATAAAGAVAATYRYYAYGSPDETGTLGEDADTAKPGTITEPLNPYRYNAKRADTALGGIDMGFRNYDPGLSSFTTRDSYSGALDDLQLGNDPWNTNRYAYAGGNPITRVELDGHLAAPIDDAAYDQEKVAELKQEFNTCGLSCLGSSNTSDTSDSAQTARSDSSMWQKVVQVGEAVRDIALDSDRVVFYSCSFPMGCEAGTAGEVAEVGAEVSGAADLNTCARTRDKEACLWTAAAVVPVGRLGKLGRLGWLASRGDDAAAAAKSVDDILPTPQVSSQGLQNHIDALYKGTTNPNRVGNGTTMDAIRNELATGVPTAGRMHSIKGQERLNGLNKWLRRNPDAPYYDRLVAQSLADELGLVLRGGG